MLVTALAAFRQILTPPFRAVLFKCLGLTIALLALLIAVVVWGLGAYFEGPHWVERTIQWFSGLGLVVLSFFLIPPVTSFLAGLFLDDVALKVERSTYPADAPGKAMPALAAIGVGLRFFIVVLGVNLVALFMLFVPGLNLLAFYLGNGYLLGREYFEMVAMRHLPPAEARGLRKKNRLSVFICGLIIAGLASVPILNLLTPLFATAFMVRIYKSMAPSGTQLGASFNPPRETLEASAGAMQKSRPADMLPCASSS